MGAAALALTAIACGGNSSRSLDPSPPTLTPSGSSCRTYPTNASVHTITTASNVTFDALETGTFDASTKKSTVLTMFANGAPCSTHVANYNSVADFVDEVRVIPGVFLVTSDVNTNSGACGAGTATGTYTYDAQRRLTQISNSAGGVTTYTAWDASGRPTFGTSSGASTSIVYDDAARTATSTQVGSSGTSVGTLTFDANGNQVRNVVVQNGVTSTTTFTITATAQVCK